ncbi:MAG: amidohydrolase [Actinomycetota bacterium]|nr:amidohydrolase [Actinomycetota bacterium]
MTVSPAVTRAIDVHAHAIFPALQGAVTELDPVGFATHQALEARRSGPASMAASGAMIGARFEQLTSLSRRLSDMDAAGVELQLLSPSPSHYYPFLGAEHARAVARLANESVRDVVAQASDRLEGLGLVPLQHPELMVELLEHAVTECGLRGVELSSFAPGQHVEHSVELSDERLEPFWARAVELGAIVFLHPFGCSLDERLDRYYLSNTVGQPVENAVALSHLIFSGVLDRHPRLTLIAAHGGGYLPTFLGRSDHAWTVRPEARGCADIPSSYLGRLYFDSLVHTPDALRALVAAVGVDRVLMGSDYPFDMGVADPVERIVAAELPDAAATAVASGNAARLGLGVAR